MKLLVSVTDLGEAQAALAGGSDIIDLKNPWESPLGASSPRVTREVCRQMGDRVPLSASIGDFPNLPGSAGLAALGALWCGVNYVKVGLYGVGNPQEAASLVAALKDSVELAGHDAKVIAVGYADHARIGAVDPLLLPEMAVAAGIDGCMIDTYYKDGSHLFTWMGEGLLRGFVEDCRDRGLIAALAGSLSMDHFSMLKAIDPDIVGVRGAACHQVNRLAAVSREKVRQLKESILVGGK